MKNQALMVILGILGTFAILTVSYFLLNKPVDKTIVTQVKAADHSAWSTKKEKLLVEYSDFQCPACKTFHDFLKKEIEATGSANAGIKNNVTLVFRHFPLTEIHPTSLDAAYAAEAAGAQGKFFEMADMLFSKQAEWVSLGKPQDKFTEYAKTLELDEKKFRADMASDSVKNKVVEDRKSGESLGINSTPTSYYQGEKVNVSSFEQFLELLKK